MASIDMPAELTPEEEAAADKLAQLMSNCGILDNLDRVSSIERKIKELQTVARSRRPDYAPRNSPLEIFLPTEQSIELRRLKDSLKIAQESLKISEDCGRANKELTSLAFQLLHRTARVIKVDKS